MNNLAIVLIVTVCLALGVNLLLNKLKLTFNTDPFLFKIGANGACDASTAGLCAARFLNCV